MINIIEILEMGGTRHYQLFYTITKLKRYIVFNEVDERNKSYARQRAHLSTKLRSIRRFLRVSHLTYVASLNC